MRNILKLAAVAVIIAGATAPAHAISEAYRKQLEASGQTQTGQIRQAEAQQRKSATYTGGIYEVQVNGACVIQRVNGFAPKKERAIRGGVNYTAATGDIFETDTRQGCHVYQVTKGHRSALARS